MIVAQTAMTTTRKTRPPQLSIPVVGRPPQPAALVVDQSPSDLPPPFTDSELQLSPTSASPSSSEPSPLDENLLYVDADEDDVSREWVDLRRRFKSNLRLRPIGSSSALSSLAREHAQQAEADLPLFDRVDSSSSSATTTTAESDPDIASPTSSVVTSHSSVYFTPISATPISAYYIGSPAPAAKIDYSTYHTPRTPSPRASRAVDPAELLTRLRAPTQPLLIDTRPLPAYLHSHIYHSANVAIPTLILKRSRKGGGFQSLDVLRQYITTDAGKRAWDELMGPEGEWDGDIVLYDEDMNEQEQENPQATAWALRPLLKRLVGRGTVDWLHGGINAVYSTPSLRPYISSGEPGSATDKVPFAFPFPTPPSQPGSGRKPGGLFQLNTQAAARSRTMPMVDSNPPTPDRSASPDARVDAIDLLEADQPAHSPLPMMSSLMVRARDQFLDDASPSPAPSQVAFNRPKPPSRRPSVPSLRQLDTRSHERLPKLSVRPVPSKSLTLAVPPSATAEHAPALLRPPRSPSHLTLAHSNHSSPTGSALGAPPGAWFSPTANASAERLPPPTPTFGRPPPSPRTPRTAMSLPPSPLTARPTPMTSQPPTSETEEAFGEFMISGILPNFLFLGPEPTTEEHVQELLGLGVKRILNLACECDDDTGLRLRQRFERYTRIPMRDTVEEDNITQGVREACEVLGMRLTPSSSNLTDATPHVQMMPVYIPRRRTCTARPESHAP